MILAIGVAVLAVLASRTSAPQHTYLSLQRLRAAYGIEPLLERRIDGRGQTVVLTERILGDGVSLSEDGPASDLRQDLAAFDAAYKLPAVNLTVVPRSGVDVRARYVAGIEEVLDAEMVHAVAPGAAIRVVPARLPKSGTAFARNEEVFVDLLRQAVHERGSGHIISISDGTSENCLTGRQISQIEQIAASAAARSVTVLASSGDWGVASTRCGFASLGLLEPDKQSVLWPAADALVTAVGGTSLPLVNNSIGSNEVAWNDPPIPHTGSWVGSYASGGGFSSYIRPAYQSPALSRYPAPTAGSSSLRGVPDVSADADPATSLRIVIVLRGQPVFEHGGGTSASTPLWAGIIALADQYARHSLGFINAALYRIAESRYYHDAFHDITAGNNTVRFSRVWQTEKGYQAKAGWDPVTGWGTPNAAALVKLLAADVRSGDWKNQ